MDYENNADNISITCSSFKCNMPGVSSGTCCFKNCYHLFRCMVSHRSCLSKSCKYHPYNVESICDISIEEQLFNPLKNALSRITAAEELTRSFAGIQQSNIDSLEPATSSIDTDKLSLSEIIKEILPDNYKGLMIIVSGDSDASVYLSKGIACHITGKKLEAKEYFQKAIEIDPRIVDFIPEDYFE